jgi:hypothetical protein
LPCVNLHTSVYTIPGQGAIIDILAVFPILYPILRTTFSKISASESAKLQQVVDELARITKGSGGEPDTGDYAVGHQHL